MNDYRNIIILCLIAMLLICFFYSDPGRLPPSVFGYRFFFVTGISMEPTYFSGDLLVVKQVDCSEIVPGDVITFFCPYSEYGTTTHRVKSVNCDKQEIEVFTFVTQGDARRLQDPLPIEACDVVGKVVRELPIGGWFHRMRMSGQSDQARQNFAPLMFKERFYGYVINNDYFDGSPYVRYRHGY